MLNNKKKILVIRLGAIGDVVFSAIIASAIKNKHPDYEIHYLVQEEIAPLLKNHPHIDRVLYMERAKQKSYKYLFNMGRTLFKERYNIIFNLNNTLKSVLLSLLAAPSKIVQKKTYGGLWVEDFFKTAKSVISDIKMPDNLTLGTDNDLNEIFKEKLSKYKKPYIIIAPGGATSKNRAGRVWNIEYWKELNSKILKEFGGTVFVCGSKGEVDLHKKLEQENVVILSGKYKLDETNALISNADFFISGDTGPLHIASAHNINTLALLGSTSPNQIRPYGKNGHWISSDYNCKYCWKKRCKFTDTAYTPCMENLSVEKVLKEIKDLHLL